uniref:Transcriptional adapter 1 n=3 Tax=Lygus hesperus TaxID=30085 RepID=A0A0A9W2S8_LYGHE
MVELDDVVSLRKKLLEALGDRAIEHRTLMRLWFAMKLSKEELDQVLSRFLTPAQRHLHNQYVLALLKGTPKTESWKKHPESCQAQFEPVDPIHCSVIERHPIFSEQPPLMVHEGTLLTTNMMLERLQYGAWELELKSATPATAEFLCVATRHFLKDIITAIVCRRKGFRTKYNKFICGVGTPQLNPWLRNVPRGKTEPFQPLRIDKKIAGYLAPNPRPAREVMEQSGAFEMAASDSNVETLEPISLSDLAVTLKMHPSLVASNFVRTVNWERLYSKIHHPTWDS